MKHIILPLLKQLLPIIFLGQFLHGCFLMPEEESVSSSTCTTDCSSPASSTGVFVDSAVAGVTYTTSSGLSGTTNASGEFSYQPGDTASFSIGDVSLGSVTASAVLTPVEVMGASDTADRKVINLARLLQTLDSDGDASNGIEITSSTRNSLSSKTLNFDVDVDTFTNDGTVSQIQTAVGRTLVSATSALNHLHSTMNERSLNSKVSSDSKLRAMGGTLGSFTFTSTKTLVGAAQNHLQGKLERLGTLSKDEIKTIIDAGKAQLTSDNLSKSESPQSVLPSFLKGAMKGIGQAKLGSDNLTKQAISNTTSGVMSLIGRFQDKLTSTSRTPARSANEKTAFENLLGLLMDTAVGSLAGTGLSKEALDDGLGEVVGAMVSSLDEAKTDAAEMTAAVQTITKKAVQKAASIPGMDASNAIKSITKNAVKGLGKTKMNPAQVTATLSKAVETVVDTLDEVEGASNLNLSAVVADVTTSSVEGLADLQQSFANNTSFDVSKAVNNIAGGATKGAGILAAAPNSDLNLTETIGSLSQSTASAVGKLTTDSNMVTALTQGIQSEINTSVDTISKDNPDLKIDPVTIKQKAQEKLQQGIAAIPKSCNFDGKKISGYGDPSSQVLAYFSKTVGFGQTCTSQTRTCDKGVLSGSYLHSSCVVQAPANCTLERQTVAHDKKIKAWEEKEVPFGNACKSQERTCTNGTLSGSYSHLSCIVRAPATAPTIVSTHPAQNANNIAVTDNITINFSAEILDRSVVDQVVVRDGNRDVMGETDTQGKVVIFKPRSAFSPGTSYSVTVKTGITDTAGTALASEITWNFNTAPVTNHYSACVGDCDTYWEIYDQNRSWPIEIETLDPSMNLNTTVVYPDPTAYFDNKTNNIPGQSYLVDKWMNRTEIKICMMFDFDDVDNLTSSRVEELRLAIEDGFWLWQRGLLGFERINRNRMEVKITKIVARNANWLSEPANIPINNNGKKGSPEGCGGVSIPGTAEGALSAEEGDFDYKFSFHDDICALGCAAAGVAGWKENILSYPADWDKDGKLEDWQGVRAYYPNIVHEMNTKNNFLLFHEIGHLTRLGDCVFPEIASIMCGNTWPPHKDFQNNGDHKTRPTPYDYAWLRKNYSINNTAPATAPAH